MLKTLPKISNALLSLLLSVDSKSRSNKILVVSVMRSQFVILPNNFLSMAVLSYWIVFRGEVMTVVFKVLIFLFISLTLPLIPRIGVVMRMVSLSVCRIMCSPLVPMSIGLAYWMRTASSRRVTIMVLVPLASSSSSHSS